MYACFILTNTNVYVVKVLHVVVLLQTQTMSVFSMSPCTAVLPPGAQLQVNVDCKADHVGKWVECLAVDISDRDPSDNPDGIPYKLVTEVCMPGL